MLPIYEQSNSAMERIHEQQIWEPEVTVICVDNSCLLIGFHGGGVNKAQAQAIALYYEEKIKAYPDNKNLGEYEVSRSSDNHAEVKYKGKQWEVLLDERRCSCRVWQVKGLPCVHVEAFIAFTRDAFWDNYVDSYFTNG
ncbi:zinc finger, SWIM-type [Artemisia annua]|uniref:Zinc finger, SWIM-type n=1 Tax=Artemisia annua TaxID=35608 RepID=A0A2U1MKM0_ARTAN|nr:zinc finger, SWIM-type [Artemisia annua]